MVFASHHFTPLSYQHHPMFVTVVEEIPVAIGYLMEVFMMFSGRVKVLRAIVFQIITEVDP